MQYNISPETIIKNKINEPVVVPVELSGLVAGTQDVSFAHNNNYSMAATGVCFTRDKWGLLPDMCNSMYKGRKTTKKKMLQYKAMHEDIITELHQRGIEV